MTWLRSIASAVACFQMVHSTVVQLQAANYLLVIGVNECPYIRLADGSRVRPLRSAESDAQRFEHFAIHQMKVDPRNITLLIGQQAKLQTVDLWFQNMQKTCKSEDSVMFYFAGHGTQIADAKPFDEEDDTDEVLCLYDSESNSEKMLVDDRLSLWIDDLPCRVKTVILDCCHSGGGLKMIGDEIQSRGFQLLAVPANPNSSQKAWSDLSGVSKSFSSDLVALFACQPTQLAYERRMTIDNRSIRSGQFTHFLIEGLTSASADTNLDGLVTRTELIEYVRQQIDESFNSWRDTKQDHQQPQLESTHPNRPIQF